jgi:hypothetical protein
MARAAISSFSHNFVLVLLKFNQLEDGRWQMADGRWQLCLQYGRGFNLLPIASHQIGDYGGGREEG